MKKLLNLAIIFSLVMVPLQTFAYGPSFGANLAYTWKLISRNSSNTSQANQENEEELQELAVVSELEPIVEQPQNEQVVQPNQPQPVPKKSKIWQKANRYGKACYQFFKKRPKTTATMFGGAAILSLLVASARARKSSFKLLRNGSKVAASYAPQAKSLLSNKYLWLGTGVCAGGLGAWVYGKRIAQNAINSAVDTATERALKKLEDPNTKERIHAVLEQQGQNLGKGITHGAANGVKVNRVAQGAGLLLAAIQAYKWFQPLFS